MQATSFWADFWPNKGLSEHPFDVSCKIKTIIPMIQNDANEWFDECNTQVSLDRKSQRANFGVQHTPIKLKAWIKVETRRS